MIFKALFGRKEAAAPAAEVGGSKELLTLSRKVDADPERAFTVFVDEMNRWWPRDYTWAGDRLETIGIEPRYNGRCYERTRDGGMSTWGTVLAFDRPRHIVIAWQITPDRKPEENQAAASRVDIRFADDGAGKCDLLLVHRDFFRHGEGWEKYRNDMAARNGWPRLIEAYVKALSG